MKRSTKLIVALLVVVAALAVIYRLMHRVPSADLEANVQMQQIITDAGCLRCHTSTPELPFYANMPVAGKIVMEDVSKAYRAFDMTQMEKDMKEGRPLNPVDLAKVEKVILDGKMPQAKYYLVHWGASFNDAKKEVALSWVKHHRMGLYTDVAVAPDFINEPIRPIADSISVDVRKVVLGNLLYHDTRLSADNTVSCASCHGLDTGGVDNKQYSEGVGGQLGGVNARPDSLQLLFQFRTILGRSCRYVIRAGWRTAIESGRNGLRVIRSDHQQTGRRQEFRSGIQRSISRRIERKEYHKCYSGVRKDIADS